MRSQVNKKTRSGLLEYLEYFLPFHKISNKSDRKMISGLVRNLSKSAVRANALMYSTVNKSLYGFSDEELQMKETGEILLIL